MTEHIAVESGLGQHEVAARGQRAKLTRQTQFGFTKRYSESAQLVTIFVNRRTVSVQPLAKLCSLRLGDEFKQVRPAFEPLDKRQRAVIYDLCRLKQRKQARNAD